MKIGVVEICRVLVRVWTLMEKQMEVSTACMGLRLKIEG